MTSKFIHGAEPDPNRGPVREFIVGPTGHFATLAELREAMELDDVDIIRALASRFSKTREAVLSKANPYEGLAPEQQKNNLERAKERAVRFYPWLGDTFAEMVGQVYERIITASVADQQRQFPRTRITDTEVLLSQPEEWDFGDPTRPIL